MTHPRSRDRAITGLRAATTAMVLASMTGTAAVAGLMARQHTGSPVSSATVPTVGPPAPSHGPDVVTRRRVVVVIHAPAGHVVRREATLTALNRLSAPTAVPAPSSPTVTPAPEAAVPAGTSSGSDPA